LQNILRVKDAKLIESRRSVEPQMIGDDHTLCVPDVSQANGGERFSLFGFGTVASKFSGEGSSQTEILF
jgi:hypothetical protein